MRITPFTGNEEGTAVIHEVDIRDRDGVPWYSAPLPRRLHRCKPQTWGWIGLTRYVERCACGAMRNRKSGPWLFRNERRKARR